MTGKGVVSFISNFSYLGDPSFLVMRQRFLAEFDALWFDCLNGDSRETGKLTPDGPPRPERFFHGIQPRGYPGGNRRLSHGAPGTAPGSSCCPFSAFLGSRQRGPILLESLEALRILKLNIRHVRPDLS